MRCAGPVLAFIQMHDIYALDPRGDLPDALRDLLDDCPREVWAGRLPEDESTRFWLDRHRMFRMLLARMEEDVRAMADCGTLTEAPAEAAIRAVRRDAAMLLNEVHGHRKIEDLHYFPRLAAFEPGLWAAFEMLDADHQALGLHLRELADTVSELVRGEPAGRDACIGRLQLRLQRFGSCLDRHLIDEEDIVLPILLRHGATLTD